MKNLLFVLLAGLSFASCQKDDNPEAQLGFATPTASNITASEATLSVEVLSGDAANANIGFLYGAADGNMLAPTDIQLNGQTVTAHIAGLQPSTAYHFYAVAGAVKSAIATFTTQSAGFVAPTFGTPTVSNITADGANVSCDFTYDGTQTVDAVWFSYKTASGSEQKTTLSTDTGNKTATLTGLTADTEYTVQLCATIGDETYGSTVANFTTLGGGETSTTLHAGWLELPATTTGSNLLTDEVIIPNTTIRNYTMLYDKSKYTAYWVAYPLVKSYIGGDRYEGSWKWNPDIDQQYQVDLRSHSYQSDGTKMPGGSNQSLPSTEIYARGHQCPDADRSGAPALGLPNLQIQTYYVTNCTPQLQNGFNNRIWKALETSVREEMLPSAKDTLYVVTGAAFNKGDESKGITYIQAKDDTKDVPVPNYYYKVLLKVHRNSAGNITAASTIGVWLEHRTYDKTETWQTDIQTVAQIEQYTGFDFFANLPDNIEADAEQNSNYNTFTSF